MPEDNLTPSFIDDIRNRANRLMFMQDFTEGFVEIGLSKKEEGVLDNFRTLARRALLGASLACANHKIAEYNLLGNLYDELELYLASDYRIISKFKIGDPQRKHVMLPVLTKGENVVTINLDDSPVFGVEVFTPENHVEYLYDSSIGISSVLKYEENPGSRGFNERTLYHKEWKPYIEAAIPLFATQQEP